MAALGAKIERQDGKVVIDGGAFKEPARELDAGNSGSTIRMLSGILAAQPFTSRIGGDESLSRRPMARIMAARRDGRVDRSPRREISAVDDSRPPAAWHRLHAPDGQRAGEELRSAGRVVRQGDTIVREPVRTRDHTEIALKEFGAEIEVERRAITCATGARLTGRELVVPGDLSSAASSWSPRC